MTSIGSGGDLVGRKRYGWSVSVGLMGIDDILQTEGNMMSAVDISLNALENSRAKEYVRDSPVA